MHIWGNKSQKHWYQRSENVSNNILPDILSICFLIPVSWFVLISTVTLVRRAKEEGEEVSVCSRKTDFLHSLQILQPTGLGCLPAQILMKVSAREFAPLPLLQCHPLTGTQRTEWKSEGPPEILLFSFWSLAFAFYSHISIYFLWKKKV